MAELVTLTTAKRHLRRTDCDTDDDIRMKLAQAQAIVLDYISDETDATWTATIDGWTDETVPRSVEAAILLQLGYLFRYRGDEPDEQKTENGDLPPGVKACLYRLRPLVIA